MSPPRGPRRLFLARLAASPEVADRARVAAHPRCPESLRERLARDGDWKVRGAVALHGSWELCERLLRDADWRVLHAAAGRRDLPRAGQEALVASTAAAVRMRVAENQTLDLDLLATLAVDERGLVRDAARRNARFGELPEGVLTEAALLSL